MFVGPHVERFFHLGFDNLRPILRVTDDRVVIEDELFAAHFGLECFWAFLDFVPMADALVLAEQLEHGEKFAIRGRVFLDGRVHARPEHLLKIGRETQRGGM